VEEFGGKPEMRVSETAPKSSYDPKCTPMRERAARMQAEFDASYTPGREMTPKESQLNQSIRIAHMYLQDHECP
jgi:hypothetical protein